MRPAFLAPAFAPIVARSSARRLPRLLLVVDLAALGLGCAVYPDGTAVVLPPTVVTAGPVYGYRPGYAYGYGPRYYGYGPRGYWRGFRGGYYPKRGYWSRPYPRGGYRYGYRGGRYWR